MLNRSPLKNKNKRDFADSDQTTKKFIRVCCVSLLAHGLFFAIVFLLHGVNLSKPLPRVVRVDLVSFVPGPVGGQAKSATQESVPEPKQEPALAPAVTAAPVEKNIEPAQKVVEAPAKITPEPVAALKPDISLKAKPKNLKDLMAEQEKKEKKIIPKKPTPQPKPKEDPEKVLKKAREKIAKEVEAENQRQISEALNRMQAAIKAKGNDPNYKADTSQSNTIGPGGSGPGTGLGRQGYEPLDIYKESLKFAIEQNWVFNDMLAGMNQNLEVRIMIKILRNGEIRDIAYETKSGNRYLDESAKQAISRANPLPELPRGMDSYDVVVSFTPRGLK